MNRKGYLIEKTENGIYAFHEETKRDFEFRFFGRARADIAVLDKGKHNGKWFVSEFRPNGRFVSKEQNHKDVSDDLWKSVSATPSKAIAEISRFSLENPVYEPISWGGGLGSQSIYYKTIDDAWVAVENAIESDTWLCSEEPIRKGELPFPNSTATLEAKRAAGYSGNEGPSSKLHSLLKQIATTMKDGDKMDISGDKSELRIEVTNTQYEYPDSCRLLLFCDVEGNVMEKLAFARSGFHKLADQLTGKTVPRFDCPEYRASGLPFYGQSFDGNDDPDAWEVEEILRDQHNGSDKIYILLVKGNQASTLWGKFSAKKLAHKMVSPYEGREIVWKKERAYYEKIRSYEVPELALTLENSGFKTNLLGKKKAKVEKTMELANDL